ncbi:HRDC domain-containing protein [Microbacter margulisiae]|uniref:Superfamily II DNA helicase RecQ n=1 Tax=Microbacter margulisiae TaxID=1350067 RepID=A0A7W5DPI2_9PORP|nr:HRDC domain-containing protein [Microbacter margulisiae]MBB3185923.1 superfamily II DNA helicase RecQ [Microbacter margulisiae]
MQVQIFHIRLTKEHLNSDQEAVNTFLESVSVTKTHVELISGPPNYWSLLVFYDPAVKQEKTEQRLPKITEEMIRNLTPEENRLYEALREWRWDKASQMKLKSFMICTNFDLLMLVKAMPKTIEELTGVKGFGEYKTQQYGEELLNVIHNA